MEAATSSWLTALAEDILDHAECFGCRCNAATALDELGLLDEVLERLDKRDPREELGSVPRIEGSAAYASSLTIALDDGTVLRGEAARDWMHRSHKHS